MSTLKTSFSDVLNRANKTHPVCDCHRRKLDYRCTLKDSYPITISKDDQELLITLYHVEYYYNNIKHRRCNYEKFTDYKNKHFKNMCNVTIDIFHISVADILRVYDFLNRDSNSQHYEMLKPFINKGKVINVNDPYVGNIITCSFEKFCSNLIKTEFKQTNNQFIIDRIYDLDNFFNTRIFSELNVRYLLKSFTNENFNSQYNYEFSEPKPLIDILREIYIENPPELLRSYDDKYLLRGKELYYKLSKKLTKQQQENLEKYPNVTYSLELTVVSSASLNNIFEKLPRYAWNTVKFTNWSFDFSLNLYDIFSDQICILKHDKVRHRQIKTNTIFIFDYVSCFYRFGCDHVRKHYNNPIRHYIYREYDDLNDIDDDYDPINDEFDE